MSAEVSGTDRDRGELRKRAGHQTALANPSDRSTDDEGDRRWGSATDDGTDLEDDQSEQKGPLWGEERAGLAYAMC